MEAICRETLTEATSRDEIPKVAETLGLSLGHCPHLEGGKERPRQQRPWRRMARKMGEEPKERQ